MKAKNILFISVCILLGAFFGILFQDRALNEKGIAGGVYAWQISLSELQPHEAQVILARKANLLLQSQITLSYGERTWQLSVQSLGAAFDLEGMVRKAYSIGRTGNLWQRFWQRISANRQKVVLTPELSLDEAEIAALGVQLAAQVDRRSRNARLEVKGTEVKIIPAITGRRLKTEKFSDFLRKAILAGEESNTLQVEKLAPDLTTDEVKAWGIKEQIAGFTTRFNPENVNRVRNVRIAAGKIDGLVVMPGKQFSFNKVVGTRGIREGYTQAPVIVDGKLVPGLGGGVCQVSSTLYNAILLADLKPTKRSHHSMPVAYLPIGRDAAVAYDYLDLRFINTSGAALLFKTYVEGDKIKVAIYGAGTGDVVNLESVVEEEIPASIQEKVDPLLQPGEQKVLRDGISGYKVKVWRTVRRGGRLLRRELISSDYYKPVSKIIAVGAAVTAEAEKEEEEVVPFKIVPVE